MAYYCCLSANSAVCFLCCYELILFKLCNLSLECLVYHFLSQIAVHFVKLPYLCPVIFLDQIKHCFHVLVKLILLFHAEIVKLSHSCFNIRKCYFARCPLFS